ncbi:MAG: thioredoxin family protein [Pseudomonadales bacterium]
MKASKIGFNPHYSEAAPSIEEVTHLQGLAIIEFGAPWCPHCQVMQSVLEHELTPKSLLHIKVYDGRGKRLGRHFKVKLWPTVILLENGTEIARVVRPTEQGAVQALFSALS